AALPMLVAPPAQLAPAPCCQQTESLEPRLLAVEELHVVDGENHDVVGVVNGMVLVDDLVPMVDDVLSSRHLPGDPTFSGGYRRPGEPAAPGTQDLPGTRASAVGEHGDHGAHPLRQEVVPDVIAVDAGDLVHER